MSAWRPQYQPMVVMTKAYTRTLPYAVSLYARKGWMKFESRRFSERAVTAASREALTAGYVFINGKRYDVTSVNLHHEDAGRAVLRAAQSGEAG